MNSRDVFEAHYKSAEVLLRVYRLLESDDGPQASHSMLDRWRNLMQVAEDEELILLLNELFVGIVRERADLRLAFFRKENLDLLLRQAVVAACSALDTFVPHLLESYLPSIVRIRQRNFLPPTDGEVRNFFRDFRWTLEEVWPLAEEASMDGRWDMISKRVLAHCRAKTLSNDASIHAVMALLSIEKPWERIAERAGEKESTLRDRLKKAVARRNDIVHRADRPGSNPDGPIAPIDVVWTQNHIQAINVIALACYDLARERVRDLKAAAPGGVEVTV